MKRTIWDKIYISIKLSFRYSPFLKLFLTYLVTYDYVRLFYSVSMYLLFILTEYVGIEPRVSVCVYVCMCVAYVCMCVCVYMCVYVSALQPKRLVRFEWKLIQIVSWMFTCFDFLIFFNSVLLTSWWPFCVKPCGHSQIFNIAPIFFKF